MNIKLITPDKPIFQVWADVGNTDNDCIIIQANDKDHARQIASQYWQDNNDIARIYSITQIDLIIEDI